MKETIAAFTKRTGEDYDPPSALRALARPLGPREACPTLFRYPGPHRLADLMRGGAEPLGPPGALWVWLAGAASGTSPRAARLFGAVAVLEPLRLTPCHRRSGQYLGVNRALEDPEALVWVPPAIVKAPIAWDRVRSAAQARGRIGPGYSDALARVAERLSAYLEELSALARSSAPGPPVPWCELPALERRRRLADLDVVPRWTKR